ncbi:MAG: sulfotransferase [Leptolyngbyaceae cyanobacterium MO_188.B28]|nr:sulfotransferase [Leptolyngbyaceae cyanobacterium MO_188.B28]
MENTTLRNRKVGGNTPEQIQSEKIRYPVWDIGLPRTGTKTFCEALKLLGYEKVQHNPSFDKLATLEAASDIGCVIFYKYLDYKHAGSKFVLCTRDLESWIESVKFICEKYPSTDKDIAILRRMLLYESVTFDRKKFIDAYHRHHADVRRYFRDRPNDLLEMNLIEGDGWEKLCPFLELPVPDVPFPHFNKRTDFYPDPIPASSIAKSPYYTLYIRDS